jgi:hypothetical protein
MAFPGQTIQVANAVNRGGENTNSAAKCGQIYGDPLANCTPARAAPVDRITNWYQTAFFWRIFSRDD